MLIVDEYALYVFVLRCLVLRCHLGVQRQCWTYLVGVYSRWCLCFRRTSFV